MTEMTKATIASSPITVAIILMRSIYLSRWSQTKINPIINPRVQPNNSVPHDACGASETVPNPHIAIEAQMVAMVVITFAAFILIPN